MNTIQISELVLDFEVYPRNDVSSQQVASLCDAIEIGDPVPPILVDQKSKRVVDGFHRVRAYERLKRDTIPATFKTYPNEAALFADAVRFNATHGRPFDTYDRQRCVQRLFAYKIKPEGIAEALRISPGKVGEILKGFAATTAGTTIPMKQGLMGVERIRPLTQQQVKANESYSGMQPTFHANQLSMILEANLFPKKENFFAAMDRLCELWGDVRSKYKDAVNS
jgi:hypothetical protein